MCTMYADRTLINRRNVTADPSKAYHADRDFFALVVKSRIIAATMKALGIESKEGQPTKLTIPALENLRRLDKIRFLHQAASMVVDEFVFDTATNNSLVKKIVLPQERQDAVDNQQLTEEGRFICRYPGCNYSFQYDGSSPPVDQLILSQHHRCLQ